jgi:hypothetical protein
VLSFSSNVTLIRCKHEINLLNISGLRLIFDMSSTCMLESTSFQNITPDIIAEIHYRLLANALKRDKWEEMITEINALAT